MRWFRIEICTRCQKARKTKRAEKLYGMVVRVSIVLNCHDNPHTSLNVPQLCISTISHSNGQQTSSMIKDGGGSVLPEQISNGS
jgi:hypothetical protein